MSVARSAVPPAALLLFVAMPAVAAWAPNGVPVAALPPNQRTIAVAPDGSNGIFITWIDERSDYLGDLYAQRLDSDGNVLWTVGGVAVCDTSGAVSDLAIISDGAGGAIVAWSDGRDFLSGDLIYVQRLDSGGSP